MALYLRPTELNEALDALAAPAIRRLEIVAGGTDFYPARVGQPLDDDVLDITALAPLRGIEDHGDHWSIGALTTWTDLIRADLPPWFDGLKKAARAVGGPQIQNAGTLIGNICNASPAADGVPGLLVLDAEINLAAKSGKRKVALANFVTGNRQTARRTNELAVSMSIPTPKQSARSHYLKLGARDSLAISIVMAAATIEPAIEPTGGTKAGGKVGRARIAVGAASPVARRLTAIEAALAGAPLDGRIADLVEAGAVAKALDPIDDIRGSAAYRLDAATTIIKKMLGELGKSMAGAA